MTGTATIVRPLPNADWIGAATLYRLSAPVRYESKGVEFSTHYVIVSTIALGYGRPMLEALALAANPDGTVQSWQGLTTRDSDARALEALGYGIAG